MSLIEIFSIIVIHWIADFILQDEKWALGKSKNWKDLLLHTYTYSLIWLIPLITIKLYGGYDLLNKVFGGPNILWFFPITFICHTITDYFTSRIVSKKFAEGKYGSAIPNFGAFTIIGFDQVLHYIQLFLTYELLK